ncbi:GNAT family N-acetyltransferase [Paenibacillus thiaminolyticus]|uniref:GNAT family N-acetyltransferase n=1 Tax=Paenibacillus thiaminolyticus TaxID=49283 RepID=A0AAP9DTP1_PANTH|nr:GNAT family N-acetyltransferase [Paenibacillus thiaminolyticus]MCY9539031.1 GNAT family N-acetyltransferase [Paenibacillus thiaminolyticus]MCY9603946.1 GNAT family N-acetyltransferase [Paenibacillus thiaminolyticus]MCY9611147.1 GNAT family N-acetyltransferase [Paenibacillus thiaminolyticus]MCY9616560.1 GNAT family N-acetyltransferase [Paenibacillus thiaminolyticus]MCY9622460.1 GNAT family N-acetyltransferase [Paenibacillus thiaminolyticus]
MTASRITIEPMQAKYNPQVSRLIVHGFRGKFQHLTSLSDEELALFFEKLFDQFPAEAASRRIVALQEEQVIGTLSIKWNADSGKKQENRKLPSWRSFHSIGTWDFLKLLIGLSLLDHQPQAGECYIADVAVHPDHRSKGIGKMLLEWAQQLVHAEPSLNMLSLHVSGKNPRAKHLYEQLSFYTHSQGNSIMRHFLFNERKWHYMILRLK